MERKTRQGCSLNELISEKIAVMRSEGRSSYKNYRSILRYVEGHYGIVYMRDVNTAFASKLHSQLKSENKSAATIRTYFALIHSILNYGKYINVYQGDTHLTRSKTYELDKVRLEKPKKRQGSYFSKEDMTKIWNWWNSLEQSDKGPKRWIGIFLASYLCNGANAADLLRMRYGSEWKNSGGKALGFHRHKVRNTSGAYIRVPITEKLAILLNSIGDDAVENGLVFGSFLYGIDIYDENAVDGRVMCVNTYASKVLRKAACGLGIRTDCSFSFARHTYCTVLNSEGVNYAVIERNMGHTLGITDNYLGEIPLEKLFESNEKLL